MCGIFKNIHWDANWVCVHRSHSRKLFVFLPHYFLVVNKQDTFSFSLLATDLLYRVSHLNVVLYLFRKACHTYCYSESYELTY